MAKKVKDTKTTLSKCIVGNIQYKLNKYVSYMNDMPPLIQIFIEAEGPYSSGDITPNIGFAIITDEMGGGEEQARKGIKNLKKLRDMLNVMIDHEEKELEKDRVLWAEKEKRYKEIVEKEDKKKAELKAKKKAKKEESEKSLSEEEWQKETQARLLKVAKEVEAEKLSKKKG